jgi:hypothetical protein
MQRGFLLETARQQTRKTLQAGLLLCAISALVLLFNYSYVYNWLAGPFAISPEIAEGGSKNEFVRVSGEFIFTGLVQEKTQSVRLLRGLLESRSAEISADYHVVPLGGSLLLVKTKHEFSGSVSEGRLVPLPDSTRAVLSKEMHVEALQGKEMYPMMLDASDISYRFDANLFVILAGVLFLIGILTLFAAIPGRKSPEKHKMMRYIARQGPLLSTIRQAEQDLLSAGDRARVGPLYVAESWIFDSGPISPLVFHMRDVVRVAKKTKESSQGKPSACSVEFWLRQDSFSHSVQTGSAECDAIVSRLRERLPWTVEQDEATFDRKWRADRKACISEMEARKRQHESAEAAAVTK